jgi:hypothetical protein
MDGLMDCYWSVYWIVVLEVGLAVCMYVCMYVCTYVYMVLLSVDWKCIVVGGLLSVDCCRWIVVDAFF